MNDLFSSSFKKCNDQKHHPYPDDVEAGKEETINLDKFFEDVENIKDDMRTIDNLHKRLHQSKEECSKAHSASAMKAIRSRMDADVSHVLKTAKFVKGKLEALERSNSANRNVPGCGPGSSADRTRSSVVSGMAKKLKTTMDDFQKLRSNISADYKDTVGRRYYTITGEKADEETVEKLIESGAGETFMQKAIQDEGRGQIMEAISEIQERHGAVKEIEKNLVELHQVFMDMAVLVDAQGQHLNNIESHVANASSFVRRGREELEEAKEIQKGSRKWTCIAICVGSCVVAVILFPLLTNTMMLANLGLGHK